MIGTTSAGRMRRNALERETGRRIEDREFEKGGQYYIAPPPPPMGFGSKLLRILVVEFLAITLIGFVLVTFSFTVCGTGLLAACSDQSTMLYQIFSPTNHTYIESMIGAVQVAGMVVVLTILCGIAAIVVAGRIVINLLQGLGRNLGLNK